MLSASAFGSVDNTTTTLIIPDITKAESNNCLSLFIIIIIIIYCIIIIIITIIIIIIITYGPRLRGTEKFLDGQIFYLSNPFTRYRLQYCSRSKTCTVSRVPYKQKADPCEFLWTRSKNFSGPVKKGP